MTGPSDKAIMASHAAAPPGCKHAALDAVRAAYPIIRADVKLELMGAVYTEAEARIRADVIAEIVAALREEYADCEDFAEDAVNFIERELGAKS